LNKKLLKLLHCFAGKQPVAKPHGNAKFNTRPYERSKPGVLENIRKLRNQGLSSQQIYEKATAEDEVDGPRDKKQVQNACFLMTNPKEHCGNAAD
jgi:hypothetical protein